MSKSNNKDKGKSFLISKNKTARLSARWKASLISDALRVP
jgi:hypothetical protein